MNRNLCHCFLYFLVVYFECVRSQSSIGDYCILKSTQKPGVCQLLESCKSAVQALKTSGIYPQNCGFQYNQPIVCCDDTGRDVSISTPSTTTTTTRRTIRTPAVATKPRPPPPPPPPPTGVVPKNPVLTKVGEKSIQKCKEYGEFVYVLERPLVSIPGAKPTKRPDCGITVVPLIVGGEIAKPKEFPHMALIGFEGESDQKNWACGGSLISEEYVLTAAHCLHHIQLGTPKYVRLGDLDTSRNNDDAKPQDFNIKTIIQHKQFKSPSKYHDIGLIQLDKKAKLNPYVRPACLNTDTKLTGKSAIASGWGKTGYTMDQSNELRKVTLEYFSTAECNSSYKVLFGRALSNGIAPDTQVCAGSHDAEKDTCQGDSGGPLQIFNAKQVYCTYRIIGVTSFGKQGCGIVNSPGVYTLVSAYLKWIEDIVWP